MEDIKYAGIDLHQSTCTICVEDSRGKRLSEATVKTEALRDFLRWPPQVMYEMASRLTHSPGYSGAVFPNSAVVSTR